MAIAIAFPLRLPAGGAPALRTPFRDIPPRVYTPFGQRRLARPMAIRPAEAERGDDGPPGRSRRLLVRLRGR